METTEAAQRRGFLYGLAAYGLWGLVPLYFKALAAVTPAEVLAHRVVWALGFLVLWVSLAGRWTEWVQCFRSPAARNRLMLTTVLIGINWFTYITSVNLGQVVQSSLGYFITPLVSVLLGMIFLGERLRPWQWVSLALASLGVLLYLLVRVGGFPWIALTLALSFGLYGLLRKQVAADGVIGLAVETSLLAPLAVGYLVWLSFQETLVLGSGGWLVNVLLLLSGVITTIPLVCFGHAARLLPLSSLGFLQYLSPSIQLLLAVAVFGEPFGTPEIASFVCIWVGLGIFSVETIMTRRAASRRRRAAALPVVSVSGTSRAESAVASERC